MKRATKSRAGAKRRSPRRKAAAAHDDGNHHMCGCDLDFTEMEETLDAHLPIAKGGVATTGSRRARTARRANA
ncbi:hypothetical protein [Taklimakanibacter lacteus]|uniref:hypothetical protein n=1 Tax=Taklimakanibacter lacteus TaxID=2268456 RepID=UPI000E6602AE